MQRFRQRLHKVSLHLGLIMGVVWQSTSIIYYSVMPIPGTIVVTWIVAGLIQGVLMGIVAWAVYKRKPDESEAPSGDT